MYDQVGLGFLPTGASWKQHWVRCSRIYTRGMHEELRRAVCWLPTEDQDSEFLVDAESFFDPESSEISDEFHERVPIPPGGNWAELKRLIQSHLPVPYRLPARQIEIDPSLYHLSPGLRLLDVTRDGKVVCEAVKDAVPAEKLCTDRHYPFLLLAYQVRDGGWWFDRVLFSQRGYRPSVPRSSWRLLVVLRGLQAMGKDDRPSWLDRWRGFRRIGVCENEKCGQYFPVQHGARCCSDTCRRAANRQGHRGRPHE
ncbi:MAG TPA: hypothetical protein VM163_06545 [bacterium]|nr:hypothetical protein [bacterium]